ncbi:MAG: hypothetical protein ACLR34_08505 [Faecalibacterium prausnitzii]|jgi:hypothetical protein
MKLTKKAAALLLAASLAVSVCATPVFADDSATTPSLPGTEATGADGLTTKVVYDVTGGYTWSVPATIDFGKDAGGGAQKRTVNATETAEKESIKATDTAGTAPKVFVTKNVIAPGKTLKINLKAQDGNAFEVKTSKDGKEATLSYKVKTTAETIDGTLTTPYTAKNVDAVNGTDILALKAGKNTGDVALEFVLTTAPSKAEIAGHYEGNVVFVADATT